MSATRGNSRDTRSNTQSSMCSSAVVFVNPVSLCEGRGGRWGPVAVVVADCKEHLLASSPSLFFVCPSPYKIWEGCSVLTEPRTPIKQARGLKPYWVHRVASYCHASPPGPGDAGGTGHRYEGRRRKEK